MIELTYKGANAVEIATKNTKLITDPKLSLVGLKDLSSKSVIVVVTEERFLGAKNGDERLVVEGPGEYEVADFSIRGVAATRHIDAGDEKNATLYRIEVEDITIGVVGNIGPKMSEEQLEELGLVDILVVPIGGNGYTLDAVSATTITKQVEPKVVVPVHYADENVSYEVPQDDFAVFRDELNAPVEELDRLKLKTAAALPAVLTVYKLHRT